ncbi:MAG: YbjN domain-containing protein [Propionibacteriaceae bacterium]|jgi:hypothetical protein|nr:YbjN domain-containing protein [Propionibacteriaceae bacterium]
MGFFTQTGKQDSSGPEVLPPLTRDRIESALKSKDWSYQIDSDGDIGGIWDDNQFYFFLAGEQKEIFFLRACWHHSLSIEQRTEARAVIDEWHMERLWPKGYTRVNDEGRVRIFSDLVVDFEHGLSDNQLLQTIICGITTSIQLFDHLAVHFKKD